MSDEIIIKTNNLTKYFDSYLAVDALNLKIKKGEFVGLLGANGAGKTTTLQMLLNLTTPTSGEIEIFGKTYKKDREEILHRLNFSSSYISLPYSLTVRENLKVYARIYEVENVNQKVDELIDIFKINEFADKRTRHLSSGQITRVCLAKALLNDPEILLLDEPTASLDPEMADTTRKLLRQIKKERNLTVLYTSHNMHEVEELCERLIFLFKGKVIAKGTPQELIEKHNVKNLEQAFLAITAKEGERNEPA